MPLRRDPLGGDADNNTSISNLSKKNASNPLEELAYAIHELIQRQQPSTPNPFHLDTRFQLPKFDGQMNGEALESWIHSLSTYFQTTPDLSEERKL